MVAHTNYQWANNSEHYRVLELWKTGKSDQRAITKTSDETNRADDVGWH
jgi:hypothetical protein